MALLLLFITMISFAESKVCKSLDVRNTPEHISEFRDCRVIEGHLHVVLIEHASDPSDYFNRTFSELYEITDYLIVYRLMGLTSLELIFPKLTSIKGENQFFGYSLILYDLPDLEEIGLTSLMSIGKGGVRIDCCPELCYVDTINWKALGVSEVTYDRLATCHYEWCPLECGGYCWNNFECQNLKKTKCSDACIGCTKLDSPNHCYQCKYFNNSGTCVKTCPPPKLIDNTLGKCITPAECTSKQWWIYHNETTNQGSCVAPTHKICKGLEINNYFDLDLMIGCTHIIGRLEIALQGYVSTYDLEVALGEVITISEYLKISRSNAITTLSFFKKLTQIQGEKLWSGWYSLFVSENQNLQELFTDYSSLEIKKGEALFQNNPNLCSQEIDKVTVKTISHGNGDKTMCNFTQFEVNVVENNPTNVTLSWPEMNTTQVVGYVVYYVLVPWINFTFVRIREGFVDRDGNPQEDGWSSIFVRNNSVMLRRLLANTYYGYYVKISAIEEKDNSQSRIFFFKTATGDPAEPVNLEALSQTDSTITLKWKRPYHLNGNLSHYKLAVYMQEDYLPHIRQRNYCLHPLKDNNCSCPEKEELQLFHSDGACIGNGNEYCKKTFYNYESETKLRIERSVDNDIQEFIVNDTSKNPTFLVYGLNYFTLYTFFLRACNKLDKYDTAECPTYKQESDECHHCGGSTTVSQRTLRKRGADAVTDVTLTLNKEVVVNWTSPKDPNSVIVAYKIEYKKPDSGLVVKCVTKCCVYNISGLKPGNYSLRVRAVSLAGSGEVSRWKHFEIAGSSTIGRSEASDASNGMAWVYGFLVFFGCVILVILVAVLWRRYKTKHVDVDNLVRRMRTEGDDEWKLDDETVEIIRELGENSIGIMFRNK